MPSALATWSRQSTPRDLAIRAFWSPTHPLITRFQRANPAKANRFALSELITYAETAPLGTLMYFERVEAA